MKEVESLRYGVIFKKAFSELSVFKRFVLDIIGIEIEIEKVETEKSFAEPVGKIASRYDLFAEDVKNRIIVDIQHERHADHYHRFLHYHCAALVEQAGNYSEYRAARTVYTIVILTSGDKHRQDVGIIDFDPKNLEGKGFGEIEHKIFYICPKYMNEKTPEPYREWLRAIEDSLDGKVDESSYSIPEVKKIFNLIERDTVSPEERARIIEEKLKDQYIDDKFNEGRQFGIHEGILKGIAQGKVEGKVEGIAEGIEKKARETARIMLKEGIEIKLIVKFTGLSENDILNNRHSD